MRRVIAFMLIVAALGTLGWTWLAHRPPVIHETADSVALGDVELTSQTLALPDDKAAFPAGPDGDLLTANCTACHSPEMILVQPPLAADKWRGEIDKMRKAYHAAIDPKNDVEIAAALGRLQRSQGKIAAK
ncbi:MAG: hypothetical protein ABIS14_05670 [Sphingomonas sp.]